MDSNDVTHDLNGNMVASITADIVYNWENKLRSAEAGDDSMAVKYDPSGNRIWKQSSIGETTTHRKYILDIVGDLPVILLELDPDDSNSVKKGYVYADSQILMQRDGTMSGGDGQIDRAVYELYGLTEEEIKMVEGGRRKYELRIMNYKEEENSGFLLALE